MATFTQKSDTKIMELLKTKEIRHYIAQTDLGDLTLMLRKGETKYRLVLDSVPVSDEIHDELMNLLYPSKIEIPQVNKKIDVVYFPGTDVLPTIPHPKPRKLIKK